MANVLRPFLAGAVFVAGLVGFTMLPTTSAGPPGARTTEDFGCDPAIRVTRVHRPGRGATPEAAVGALIRAWYPNEPGQTVERLPVIRPDEPGSSTHLIRRDGEPFETIVVRRAPYQGRNGYEATLDEVCGSHADAL